MYIELFLSLGKRTKFFFAGGPSTLFYVTSHGLGARTRDEKGLFFVCLYIQPDTDEKKDIYIYKTPYPQPFLIEELVRFRTMSEQGREDYIPDALIQDKAYKIIQGVINPRFSFSDKDFEPFSGSQKMDTLSEEEMQELSISDWTRDTLPKQIQIDYTLKDASFKVHTAISEHHEG